jgi:hypothetical protein
LIAIQSQGQSSRPTPTSDGQDKIVKLFPNPATAYVTFDMQKSYKQGLTLSVYSGVMGRKMYESANVPSLVKLDLNDFSRGVYIYHLIDASGRILETGKFQVSK